MAKRKPRFAPRKPGAPDAAAQRFVEGRGPGSQSPGISGYKPHFPRASGREVERLISYVPPELKRKLQIWCLEHNVKISDQIELLVARFLEDASHR